MKALFALTVVAVLAALIFPSAPISFLAIGFVIGVAYKPALLNIARILMVTIATAFLAACEIVSAVRTPAARIVARLALVAAAIAGTIALSVGAAYAADAVAAPAASTVSIPWGDWISGLLATSGSIFLAVVSWGVKSFLPSYVQTFLTNDVIAKAVDYALASVAGAVRNETATVPVSNEVIAAALKWIVAYEPKVAKWAGDNLEPLIIARLSALNVIPATASASTLGAS
ncbi:hypothetical protein [Methylosinus sp. PW1]|uniref:hypothetical protein n=1 Tax=Methylosinus sp. PW1 TaxID=107636 RepID=UPI00055C4DF6|nr:hypothetical protein [Methylosinus sp. PW1]